MRESEGGHFSTGISKVALGCFLSLAAPPPTLSVSAACFAPQIIFHKENPGIDYEFYIPVEKKEGERERLTERQREPAREAPRERSREREPARAPLRSKSFALQFFLFYKLCFLHVSYSSMAKQETF